LRELISIDDLEEGERVLVVLDPLLYHAAELLRLHPRRRLLRLQV
jgi:hypothetical protein